MNNIPIISVNWQESFRIIPAIFPEKTIFDFVESEEELEYIYYIESLTDEKIKNDLGKLETIPKNEWLYGEGTTPIMAAFTHPKAARFNTEFFGVYYASKELITAIRETVYHREKFYIQNSAPAGAYHMKVYSVSIKGNNFYDIRNKDLFSEYYLENDYTKPQQLGIKAKKENKDGIIYKSVRHKNGTNIAVLRPKSIIPPCKVVKLLIYYWDGKKINTVSDLGKGENLLN